MALLPPTPSTNTPLIGARVCALFPSYWLPEGDWVSRPRPASCTRPVPGRRFRLPRVRPRFRQLASFPQPLDKPHRPKRRLRCRHFTSPQVAFHRFEQMAPTAPKRKAFESLESDAANGRRLPTAALPSAPLPPGRLRNRSPVAFFAFQWPSCLQTMNYAQKPGEPKDMVLW